MSLGPTAARKRTRDLAEFIRSGAPKGADVLEIAARELAPVLDTEQTVGIRLDVADGGVSLASVRSPFDGASRVERSLRAQVENQPRGAALFDPTAPDPAQRNVVLSLAELQQMTGRSVCSTPVGQLLLHSGFSLSDVVRTLLCDGPVLLAWFGAFRDRPFDGRERGLLCTAPPAAARSADTPGPARLRAVGRVGDEGRALRDGRARRSSSGAPCASCTATPRRGRCSSPTGRRCSPGSGRRSPGAVTGPGSSSDSPTWRDPSTTWRCAGPRPATPVRARPWP